MTSDAYRVAEVEDAGEAACTCDNCDWKGSANDTTDIIDCALTPGDASPVGRCPECDGLVYLDHPLRSTESAAEQLVRQCGGDVWAECSQYPRSGWKAEVMNGDTNLGYWPWVVHQAEADHVALGDLSD